MSDLEKWYSKVLKEKNKQGLKCEISSYVRGRKKKYMFLVNGEPRNIENYLQPEEIVQLRTLTQKSVLCD
jgi:hypothetical protein